MEPARNKRGQELFPVAGQLLAGYERAALNKNEMTANIERGRFKGKPDRIIESIAVCHECCGAQDTVAMAMDDAGVDVGSEPEIVGIEDQVFRRQQPAQI